VRGWAVDFRGVLLRGGRFYLVRVAGVGGEGVWGGRGWCEGERSFFFAGGMLLGGGWVGW